MREGERGKRGGRGKGEKKASPCIKK